MKLTINVRVVNKRNARKWFVHIGPTKFEFKTKAAAVKKLRHTINHLQFAITPA